MSGKLMHEVGTSGLPQVRKLVALAYASRANEDGTNAHPVMREVVHWARSSEASIRWHRKQLELDGILMQTEAGGYLGGKWWPATYRVVVTAIPKGDRWCVGCGEAFSSANKRKQFCTETCRKMSWKTARLREGQPSPMQSPPSPVTVRRAWEASPTSFSTSSSTSEELTVEIEAETPVLQDVGASSFEEEPNTETQERDEERRATRSRDEQLEWLREQIRLKKEGA
jgi:hypothetical protein